MNNKPYAQCHLWLVLLPSTVERKSAEGFRQIPLFDTQETLIVMYMNGSANNNGLPDGAGLSELRADGGLDLDRVRGTVF